MPEKKAAETSEKSSGNSSEKSSGKLTKKQVAELSQNALDRFLSDNDLTPVSVFPLPAAKHIFSHVEWHMTGYDIEVESLAQLPSEAAGSSDADRADLFACHLSEVDRYSIPNAFDAFKF